MIHAEEIQFNLEWEHFVNVKPCKKPRTNAIMEGYHTIVANRFWLNWLRREVHWHSSQFNSVVSLLW